MPTPSSQAQLPAWKAYFNRLARDPAIARLRGQVDALLSDLDIVILLEHGDVDGAALLLAKRRKDADEKQREAIDFILTHRRLLDAGESFAPPGNFRLLGTGTHLYGAADYDPADKTFLARRRLTIFGIPVLTLGAYRAVRDEKGRLKPVSRVPLEAHRLSARGVRKRVGLVALIVLVLAGLFLARPDMVAFHALPSAVHIVNGLEFPVSVSIGEVKVDVPALGRATHPLGKGYFHVVAYYPSGEILEENNIDNKDGKAVFAYNILGVAPLYENARTFTSDGLAESQDTMMALERVLKLDAVNGVFVPAPEHVRVPFWKKEVSRKIVDVSPGGWLTTLKRLDDTQSRWTVVTRTLAVDPMNEAAYRAGVDVLYAMEPKEAIQSARSFYSEHWDSINAQRMLMWTMIRAAGRDGAIDAYQTLQMIAPESANGALLTAQVAPPDKAMSLLEPAVKLYSKEFFLRLNYARTLYLLGRFDDAIAQYEILVGQHDRALRSCYKPYALSLVAAGKTAEAVRLVARAGDLEGFPVDFTFAVFYGRLASHVAAALRPHPTDEYLNRTRFHAEAPSFATALFQALATGTAPDQALMDQLPDQNAVALVRVIGAMREGPSLAAARQLNLETLRKLDNVRLILLAGEFVRRGQTEDAKALIQALHLWSPWIQPAASALEKDNFLPDVADMDLEVQAALKLVHARRLGAKNKDYEKLVAEALKLDLLGDTVTTAARWPLTEVPGARAKPDKAKP